jgi:hypothetical protein
LNCSPRGSPGRVSRYLESGCVSGSGYVSSRTARSGSERPGRRVRKKDVKSVLVERFFGTKMAPSLVLKPVRMGILVQLPDLQASMGRMGMMPPSPSMTGWKGHRMEGL